MDSTGLLDLFRVEMNDTAKPYLWSDEEVIGYIDDAQKMFCRKTDGIPDDETTEVCVLEVVPGTDRLDLHPSIRRVRSATRRSNGRPVEVLNPENTAERGYFFDGRPGPVRALVIGGSNHRARVWPLSDETETLDLAVYRLPLTTIDDTDIPLEVDSEHHPHLLMWCKHRAYSKQDTETVDRVKAAEFEAKFNDYCEQVTREEARKRHKTRTVAYGGY